MGTFAIPNTGNRKLDLKKAKLRISKRNEERDFKNNQQVFKSLRQASAGKTLGGTSFKKGSHLIVTTRARKRRSK